MNKDALLHPSRILCPIDFSELSDLALKYAATGARVFSAGVVVFHAQRFELPPYFTAAQIGQLTRQRQEEQKKAKDFLRRHVRQVLGEATAKLTLKFDLSDAHPVDAVLSAIKRHKAELVVMGTHGRGGARRLWLGSVAENVLHQAGVPVFIVRQKQHEFINTQDPQAVPALKTILCPVSFTPADRLCLEHAASLAQRFNAQLVTACIVERGDSRSLDQTRRKLASWLGRTDTTGCEVDVVVRKGRAGGEIVSLASRTRADLLVIGAGARRSLATWVWGDTTEWVVRQAPAPVLVVPS